MDGVDCSFVVVHGDVNLAVTLQRFLGVDQRISRRLLDLPDIQTCVLQESDGLIHRHHDQIGGRLDFVDRGLHTQEGRRPLLPPFAKFYNFLTGLTPFPT